MQNNISSMGFTVTNNVFITVENKKTHKTLKQVETHNKATRRMVSGMLKFLSGKFNVTNLTKDTKNKDINLSVNGSENYIPCYIGFGDGYVKVEESKGSDDPTIPILDNPSNYVDYISTHLIHEHEYEDTGTRSPIKFASTTFDVPETVDENVSFSDMDSIYFYCVVPPNTINHNLEPAYITEVGLFSNNIGYNEDKGNKPEDLLAYVKLLNYESPDIEQVYSVTGESVTIQADSDSEFFKNKFIVPVDITLDDNYVIRNGIILNNNVPCGTFNYNTGHLQFDNAFSEKTNFTVNYSYYGTINKTNALYVRPEDTIIIRWVITIAAIGIDSTFSTDVVRDVDNVIKSVKNDVIIPDITPVEIIVLDDEPNPNNNENP